MTLKTTTNEPLASSTAHAVEPWPVFAEWATEQLGLEWSETDDGRQHVRSSAPEGTAECAATEGSGRWPLLTLRPRKRRLEPELEGGKQIDFTADTPQALVTFLIEQLAALERHPVLMPASQPGATHEIANRLLGAYQVDGGRVHLAGCRLEATRVVRHSTCEEDCETPIVRHVFTDPSGQPLSDDLIATLALTGPLADVESGCTALPTAGDSVTGIVLAKRATGAVEAEIDGHQLSIPFNDWTQTLTAPPAVCPESGRETFHLLTVDDGRIAAAEATGVCAASGRRLLLDELRTCAATGQTLAAELGTECPVSGEWVASEQFAPCPKCQQSVSPAVLGKQECAGCCPTKPLPVDSPRRESLLQAAPLLKEWRRWRLAETQTVTIVEAATFWSGLLGRRLLVVIDRQSNRPVYAAVRPRFGGQWVPLPLSELSR